jgi:hypothetical protein
VSKEGSHEQAWAATTAVDEPHPGQCSIERYISRFRLSGSLAKEGTGKTVTPSVSLGLLRSLVALSHQPPPPSPIPVAEILARFAGRRMWHRLAHCRAYQMSTQYPATSQELGAGQGRAGMPGGGWFIQSEQRSCSLVDNWPHPSVTRDECAVDPSMREYCQEAS